MNAKHLVYKVAFAAPVAAALLLAPVWQDRVDAEPAIKQPAPALKVETADGKIFNLAAMRGKVVLVDFWATWCAPCLAELPVIEKYHRKYHAMGFEVIALSVDKPRDREKMRQLIGKLPFEAALLSDATRNGFGTPDAVPVSYVIDAHGVVRDKFIAIDDDLLDEVVLPLLDEASAQHISSGGAE